MSADLILTRRRFLIGAGAAAAAAPALTILPKAELIVPEPEIVMPDPPRIESAFETEIELTSTGEVVYSQAPPDQQPGLYCDGEYQGPMDFVEAVVNGGSDMLAPMGSPWRTSFGGVNYIDLTGLTIQGRFFMRRYQISVAGF